MSSPEELYGPFPYAEIHLQLKLYLLVPFHGVILWLSSLLQDHHNHRIQMLEQEIVKTKMGFV